MTTHAMQREFAAYLRATASKGLADIQLIGNLTSAAVFTRESRMLRASLPSLQCAAHPNEKTLSPNSIMPTFTELPCRESRGRKR